MKIDVPDGWVSTQIGETVDRLQYGYTAKASAIVDGPKFLRITDISDQGVEWGTVPSCVITSVDFEKYRLQDGDLVFARSGSIEKAWRVRDCPDAVFASYLIRGRPVIDHVGPWLEHFVKSREYLSQVGAAAAGIGMSNVNAKSLASIRLPLPPLNEQRRIVAKVEALMARSARAKEALDAIPALLDRYRQSVLAAAFRGDLTADWRAQHPDTASAQGFLSDRQSAIAISAASSSASRDMRSSLLTRDAELSAALEERHSRRLLPQTWAWAGVGEVFGVYVGATPSRKEPPYWGGSIPWVSSGEVAFCRISNTEEMITEEGLRNTSTRVHPPGTILLGMIGEGKTRGQAAILDIAACNNQNCAAIRVSETEYPPEYLYWYLVFEYERTRTLGGGNNQPALNKQRVQRLSFPLAPVAEAHAIVAAIDKAIAPRLGLANRVTGSRQSIDELDQSILAKAFRGELVPQDPNDEPASELLARINAERTATGTPSRRGGRRKRAVAPVM